MGLVAEFKMQALKSGVEGQMKGGTPEVPSSGRGEERQSDSLCLFIALNYNAGSQVRCVKVREASGAEEVERRETFALWCVKINR